MCVFIGVIFEDMIAMEELLIILPLKGHTRVEVIFNAFVVFVSDARLPLWKLISIETDGAPAQLGGTELSLHSSPASIVRTHLKYERSDG